MANPVSKTIPSPERTAAVCFCSGLTARRIAKIAIPILLAGVAFTTAFLAGYLFTAVIIASNTASVALITKLLIERLTPSRAEVPARPQYDEPIKTAPKTPAPAMKASSPLPPSVSPQPLQTSLEEQVQAEESLKKLHASLESCRKYLNALFTKFKDAYKKELTLDPFCHDIVEFELSRSYLLAIKEANKLSSQAESANKLIDSITKTFQETTIELKPKIILALKKRSKEFEKKLNEEAARVEREKKTRSEGESKSVDETERKSTAERVSRDLIDDIATFKRQLSLLRDHSNIPALTEVSKEINDLLHQKLPIWQAQIKLIPAYQSEDIPKLFATTEMGHRDRFGLPNIKNSCYINATIAMMRPFLHDLIGVSPMEEVRKAEEVYPLPEQIKDTLRRVLDLSSTSTEGRLPPKTSEECPLSTALHDLRFRVYESRLSLDLKYGAEHGYTGQQDAIAFANTILEIFKWKMTQIKEGYGFVKNGETLERREIPPTKGEPVSFLPLDLPITEGHSLQALVDSYFGEQTHTDKFRDYEPGAQYHYRLQGPPPRFLPLQVKRATTVADHTGRFFAQDQRDLDAKIASLKESRGWEIEQQLKIEGTPKERDEDAYREALANLAYDELCFSRCDQRSASWAFGTRKISTPILFPEGNIIDLSKAWGEAAGRVHYRVRAAMLHSGGASGGHYTTAAFDEDNRTLRLYNDNSVTIIATERHAEVLASATAILLELIPPAPAAEAPPPLPAVLH